MKVTAPVAKQAAILPPNTVAVCAAAFAVAAAAQRALGSARAQTAPAARVDPTDVALLLARLAAEEASRPLRDLPCRIFSLVRFSCSRLGSDALPAAALLRLRSLTLLDPDTCSAGLARGGAAVRRIRRRTPQFRPLGRGCPNGAGVRGYRRRSGRRQARELVRGAHIGQEEALFQARRGCPGARRCRRGAGGCGSRCQCTEVCQSHTHTAALSTRPRQQTHGCRVSADMRAFVDCDALPRGSLAL